MNANNYFLQVFFLFVSMAGKIMMGFNTYDGLVKKFLVFRSEVSKLARELPDSDKREVNSNYQSNLIVDSDLGSVDFVMDCYVLRHDGVCITTAIGKYGVSMTEGDFYIHTPFGEYRMRESEQPTAHREYIAHSLMSWIKAYLEIEVSKNIADGALRIIYAKMIAAAKRSKRFIVMPGSTKEFGTVLFRAPGQFLYLVIYCPALSLYIVQRIDKESINTLEPVLSDAMAHCLTEVNKTIENPQFSHWNWLNSDLDGLFMVLAGEKSHEYADSAYIADWDGVMVYQTTHIINDSIETAQGITFRHPKAMDMSIVRTSTDILVYKEGKRVHHATLPMSMRLGHQPAVPVETFIA